MDEQGTSQSFSGVDLRDIFRRKPIIFPILAVCYGVIVALGKWQFHPTWATGWFFMGIMLGVYFMDVAEAFFHLKPSPFQTVTFAWLFAVVSVFVVTSSGSMLATGLVLSLYGTLVVRQGIELRERGTLSTWYPPAASVSVQTQRWGYVGLCAVLLILTIIFAR